ncbi:hypothetical protein C5167_017805 [Papaver somniferum]|uniref:Uncharacterized protein n=1 Tax=Papaver somniferum TaxID=3469 RepID=A0A4Y7IPG4_PAPSO|nr:hypothetical protein C5167_017805 [Papaver somniferum]
MKILEVIELGSGGVPQAPREVCTPWRKAAQDGGVVEMILSSNPLTGLSDYSLKYVIPATVLEKKELESVCDYVTLSKYLVSEGHVHIMWNGFMPGCRLDIPWRKVGPVEGNY